MGGEEGSRAVGEGGETPAFGAVGGAVGGIHEDEREAFGGRHVEARGDGASAVGAPFGVARCRAEGEARRGEGGEHLVRLRGGASGGEVADGDNGRHAARAQVGKRPVEGEALDRSRRARKMEICEDGELHGCC